MAWAAGSGLLHSSSVCWELRAGSEPRDTDRPFVQVLCPGGEAVITPYQLPLPWTYTPGEPLPTLTLGLVCGATANITQRLECRPGVGELAPLQLHFRAARPPLDAHLAS